MFTITELANDNVLVEGTDARGKYGEQVLAAGAYFERKRQDAVSAAHDAFDESFAEFFAPIVEAAEALGKAHEIDVDPLLYVVEQEASEGAPARDKIVVRLDNASVILRAIETGNSDRLIWVNDELVVTAKPVAQPVAEETEVEGEPEGEVVTDVADGEATPSV